jgi:hypothetical protein
MNRKLKALGLAFVAALALTAVMASAAMAEAGFTSSVSNPTLHGEQEGSHEFTASASSGFGGITCSTVTFSGTGEGTFATSQTITPTWSGCKDSFGRTVNVVTNSIHLSYTVTGTDGNGRPIGTYHTKGHLETTVITGGTHCTDTIKIEQTLGGVTFDNFSGLFRITTNTNEVTSTTSGGFFACGISNGEHTDGEYTGTTLMEATEGEISVDAH